MTAALQSSFERRRLPTVAIGRGVTTPRWFTDPAGEHLATRQAAGLFDFSFMGCAEIAGGEAFDCLDRLQTRNLAGLAPGRIAYTLLLREDGAVLDDATVWNFGQNRYALFVGRRDDLTHVARVAESCSAGMIDRSNAHAVLALQGPQASRIMRDFLAPAPLPDLPYYAFASIRLRGEHGWLARIGYSGEHGYELVVPAHAAPALWEALAATGGPFGLVECGFDAIDSLRIEAGHLLFQREFAEPAWPSEVGLERLVEPLGRSFHGAAGARRAPARQFVGLLPFSRGALQHAHLQSALERAPSRLREGATALTSARFSPLFERCLGLGFVAPGDRHPGTRITLGDGLSARVARLPFYDPAKCLARGPR